MIQRYSVLFGLALCLMPALAQSAAVSSDNRDRAGGTGASVILSAQIGDQMVTDAKYCDGLAKGYQLDCYKYVFRLAAQSINGNQAYRTAETVFRTLDKHLALLAKEQLDMTRLPKLRGLQFYRHTLPDIPASELAELATLLDQSSAQLAHAPDAGPHYARLIPAFETAAQGLRRMATAP